MKKGEGTRDKGAPRAVCFDRFLLLDRALADDELFLDDWPLVDDGLLSRDRNANLLCRNLNVA